MPARTRSTLSGVFLFLLAIQPVPLFAVTSSDLIEALGIQQFTSDHTLQVATGQTLPPKYLDPDDALMAAAIPDEKTIILSSGLAVDRGLGSTDLSQDGQRDFTSFSFTLNIPEGAKTLVFGQPGSTPVNPIVSGEGKMREPLTSFHGRHAISSDARQRLWI